MNRVADIPAEPARRTDFSNSGGGGGSIVFPNSGQPKKRDLNTGPMGEAPIGGRQIYKGPLFRVGIIKTCVSEMFPVLF